MQARLLSKTRKNQNIILRFVKMTFIHELALNTKGKTRSHLAECESFKTRPLCRPILVQPIQHVNSLQCVQFNPFGASKRPTAHERSLPSLRYVRIHQMRHHVVVGSSSNRQGVISQCSLGYSMHTACFSSSLFFSRHGPFIVRGAQPPPT